MSRIRSLKPEFWTDGKIVQLSFAARLFFQGTWSFARCDRGHLDDDALGLKLKILPADDVDAEALLGELLGAGLLDRYEADGRTFLHIRRFSEHQKLDTRWNSRCPYCALQDSANPTEPPADSQSLAETPSPSPQEGTGGEGLGQEGNNSSPAPQSDDSFEQFWKTYPTQRNGKKPDKGKALDVWERLSAADRTQALNAVGHYRADCETGTFAKHAHRWLRDRTFMDWQTPAQPSSNGRALRGANDDWSLAERGLA